VALELALAAVAVWFAPRDAPPPAVALAGAVALAPPGVVPVAFCDVWCPALGRAAAACALSAQSAVEASSVRRSFILSLGAALDGALLLLLLDPWRCLCGARVTAGLRVSFMGKH
jgi:hypothetical protein